jgi:hypothetical protein
MPAEIPQNAGYMIAAYVVAPVILVGYLGALWGRFKRAEKAERAERAERLG